MPTVRRRRPRQKQLRGLQLNPKAEPTPERKGAELATGLFDVAIARAAEWKGTGTFFSAAPSRGEFCARLPTRATRPIEFSGLMLDHGQLPMMVAMVAVGTVEVARNEVVHVIAVRHHWMPAIGAMHMPWGFFLGPMTRRASDRIVCADGDDVFVHMRSVGMMQVARMEVVNVSLVKDGGMTAVGAVNVCVRTGMSRVRRTRCQRERQRQREQEDFLHDVERVCGWISVLWHRTLHRPSAPWDKPDLCKQLAKMPVADAHGLCLGAREAQ